MNRSGAHVGSSEAEKYRMVDFPRAESASNRYSPFAFGWVAVRREEKRRREEKCVNMCGVVIRLNYASGSDYDKMCIYDVLVACQETVQSQLLPL